MSDFTSAVPRSADWTEGQRTCRSTGYGVLADLRIGLIWERLPSMDGDAEAAATQQEVDEAGSSGWSASVFSSLAALLTRYGHTAYVAIVRNDAARRGSPISSGTMQAVLWAAYGTLARASTTGDGKGASTTNVNVHTGSPSQYNVPQGSVLPVVGSVPPVPTDQIRSGSRACGPLGSNPPQQPITATGIRTIDPVLLALLIAAAALAGVAIMSGAHSKQGARW